MIFGQPPFEKSAGIEAWRRVTLEVDQIPRLLANTRPEDVIKPDFGERRERCVARNVAADVGIVLIGSRDHGRRVPANQAFEASFQSPVTGIGNLLFYRYGVEIGSRDLRRGAHA